MIVGYSIYSKHTKKFLCEDHRSGGYCFESENPVNGPDIQGIWLTKEAADKYLKIWGNSTTYLKNGETYKIYPVTISAE